MKTMGVGVGSQGKSCPFIQGRAAQGGTHIIHLISSSKEELLREVPILSTSSLHPRKSCSRRYHIIHLISGHAQSYRE
jgi:hypothetical protein